MKRALAILLWLPIIIPTSVMSCANTDSGRKAIEALAKTHASTADAYVKWDLQHQQGIARAGKAAGKSPDQIENDLKAYRQLRDTKIVPLFIAVDRALETGPLLLALVDDNQMGKKDIDTYLIDLLALVKKLGDALQDLGFDVHGVGGGGS